MTTSTGRPTHCQRLASMRSPVTNANTFRRRNRSGFTLIEILIALTMTLIVLGAMAQAFQFASGEIAGGRAILEMSNRLRNAQQLMRTDLAGLTVDVRPHTETTSNGYFEYVDGPGTDKTTLNTTNGYLGDVDDMLAFTSRNLDGSFRGRFTRIISGNEVRESIQSQFAEIIWFTEASDLNGDGTPDTELDDVGFSQSVSLYRRVLLIRPNLNDQPNSILPLDTGDESTGNPADDTALQLAIKFFVNNDISARWIDTDDNGLRDLIVANSLTDLARREYRFGRVSTTFPHAIDRIGISLTKMGAANISGPIGNQNLDVAFSGDDILLTDVAGFDVQIYSPNAEIDLVDIDGVGGAETALNPSDIGYVGTLEPLPPGVFPRTEPNGGFIDLAINNGVVFDRSEPFFSTRPTNRSKLRVANPSGGFDHAYCTWSPHYESDGVNQDRITDGIGVTLIDEGTDGIDNRPFINGVDDDSERETAPPYPFPVRGLKVTFRIIEKNTKQVRQTSVIQNLLPQ